MPTCHIISFSLNCFCYEFLIKMKRKSFPTHMVFWISLCDSFFFLFIVLFILTGYKFSWLTSRWEMWNIWKKRRKEKENTLLRDVEHVPLFVICTFAVAEMKFHCVLKSDGFTTWIVFYLWSDLIQNLNFMSIVWFKRLYEG